MDCKAYNHQFLIYIHEIIKRRIMRISFSSLLIEDNYLNIFKQNKTCLARTYLLTIFIISVNSAVIIFLAILYNFVFLVPITLKKIGCHLSYYWCWTIHYNMKHLKVTEH